MNMGIQALRSLAGGKMHLEITHKVSCFFKIQGKLKSKRITKAESAAEKGPK